MRGVIDNGFELTGPIARGDWETVERHLGVIRETRPELEELYLVLARATAGLAGRELPRDNLSQGDSAAPTVCRTIDELRAELARRRSTSVGLVPTMGSLHGGHLLCCAPPAAVRDGRDEPLRQSGPVLRGRRRSLSTRRGPRSRARCGVGRRPRVRASAERCTPTDSRPGSSHGARRRPRGRVPTGALPRRRNRRPQASVDRTPAAHLLRTEGCPAGGGDPTDGPRISPWTSISVSSRRSATRTGSHSRHNSLLSAEERKRSRSPGRSRRATPTRRAACSRSRTDSRSTTSRSPISTRRSSPVRSVSARHD